MKYYVLLLISLILLSCHGKNQNLAERDTSNSPSIKENKPIKSLSEIKITLLDAQNEKAELLLGRPDVRGKIMDGLFYYTVYFSKVMDAGHIKHLILFIDGKNGITDKSPIYKIVAVNDGETINRAGNFAQWLKVSKNKLESNAIDFSIGQGSNNWLDVDYSGGGVVKSQGNIVGDTKIINTLSELPAPNDALKDKLVKKYKILKYSAIDIFNWYSEHYKAKRIDGSSTGFSIPYYSDTDSCILVSMTGLLDGVRIEFSFQCDGGD